MVSDFTQGAAHHNRNQIPTTLGSDHTITTTPQHWASVTSHSNLNSTPRPADKVLLDHNHNNNPTTLGSGHVPLQSEPRPADKVLLDHNHNWVVFCGCVWFLVWCVLGVLVVCGFWFPQHRAAVTFHSSLHSALHLLISKRIAWLSMVSDITQGAVGPQPQPQPCNTGQQSRLTPVCTQRCDLLITNGPDMLLAPNLPLQSSACRIMTLCKVFA
ncbi:hypothetical protein J6590_048766 [Homalodisca vitripennis]|nr:hypothetical protein J6590_048766 [Homalodisca vitripennis]